MFCSKCGKEIHNDAVICIHCGCAVNREGQNNSNDSDNTKEWAIALLLCWVFGCFGVHRFYTGHIGIGIAQLLTLGGCGLWGFIDWILLCFNQIKTKDGKSLGNYKKNVAMILFAVGLAGAIFAVLIFIASCVLSVVES